MPGENQAPDRPDAKGVPAAVRGDGGYDVMWVETPESVAFSLRLAGAASRSLAFMLDSFIILLLLLAELAVTGLTLELLSGASRSGIPRVGSWVLAAFVVAAFLTTWGYFVYGEVFANGRTFGKRRLGLRVVRDDGRSLSFTDSVIRNVVRIVDMLPGYAAVGLLSMVLSRENRRLGDMAAGTIVVKDSGAPRGLPTPGEEREGAMLAAEYLRRREDILPVWRAHVAASVLSALGEQAEDMDEPAMAARLVSIADTAS